MSGSNVFCSDNTIHFIKTEVLFPMNTIKKFIHYYGPYKAVFFIDLICAAVISLVDLAYPQILRTMTKTLFTQDKDIILHALL